MSWLLQLHHFRSCSLDQRSHLARTTISEWIANPPAGGRESRHFDNNTIYHCVSIVSGEEMGTMRCLFTSLGVRRDAELQS